MATSTITSTLDDSESCIICSSKYNRTRPSFCQCRHCSIPLCLDCMKEHHDDILQNVAQLSHQYNELQELVQAKQKMILDETKKTIEHVNNYFSSYIVELLEAQQKIIGNLQTTKQDAEGYILNINSKLQSLGIDIGALAKESIVQTAKMNIVSAEMNKVEQQLNTYQVMRTENLVEVKPTFSIKFDHSPVTTESSHSIDIEMNKNSGTDTKESLPIMRSLDTVHQPVPVQKFDDFFVNDDHNSSVSDDDDSSIEDDKLSTSYNVDRMASDGENILYTSYYDEGPDIIAYYLKDYADPQRDWKQLRIKDMIWWDAIKKFICANEGAVYTVEYIHGRFKILCVLRNNYSDIRIAANATNFFIYYTIDGEETNEIELYTTNFQFVRVMDVRDQKYLSTSKSICVTDQLLASICTRMQNNRQVFQVNFFDWNMKELQRIHLGKCDDSIEIRSDGNKLFFISTGQKKLHIVAFNGSKQTINLQNDGDCIAVLNHRRIAISYGRSEIELINY